MSRLTRDWVGSCELFAVGWLFFGYPSVQQGLEMVFFAIFLQYLEDVIKQRIIIPSC